MIREEVSREEAQRRIAEINEPYKLEILAGLEDPITIYHLGDQWWDLCAGPHLENTREIDPKAIDLESVAGAYWRGDATKAQLQRIDGTAWEAPEQLTEYKGRKEGIGFISVFPIGWDRVCLCGRPKELWLGVC